MNLAALADSRENNLNLIRALAAFAVLYTHSFALATGTPDAEPWRLSLGMTPATMAVDIFFIASGFLVTGSIMKNGELLRFAVSRALRIFPGLLVAVSITAFILGPLLTKSDMGSYFSSPHLIKYLAYCSTVVFGIRNELPGVFSNNPFGTTVNGSLWTLPHEVRLYIALGFLWAFSRLFRIFKERLFGALCLALTLALAINIAVQLITGTGMGKFSFLAYMFFTGSSYYLLRKYVVLNGWFAALATIILLLATNNSRVFTILYALSIGYILFCCAYLINGPIRAYNKLGDYSYGIYIYAFPIQQTILATIPGTSANNLTLFATPIVLAASILSWELVEKRSLMYRDHVINAILKRT